MIQWNELRITPDSKNIIIDVSIDNLDYFDNMTITDVIIDNQKTQEGELPSGNPVYIYDNRPKEVDNTYSTPENGNCNPVLVEDKSYCFTYNTEKLRHVRLILSPEDFIQPVDFAKDLFFVYVKVEGTPKVDTPCNWDKEWYLHTVCNLLPIYQEAMKYVREVKDDCEVSINFIDRILEYKAFSLAISTGNYVLAKKYWKKFFEKIPTINTSKTCGCNGLY